MKDYIRRIVWGNVCFAPWLNTSVHGFTRGSRYAKALAGEPEILVRDLLSIDFVTNAKWLILAQKTLTCLVLKGTP